MDLEHFQNCLRQTGTYRTPETPVLSRWDRLFGRCDAWFHIKVFRAVASGFLRARRRGFDAQTWAEYSLRILRTVEQCGGRVRITGGANLFDVTGPVVFAGNHMSMLETLLIGSFMNIDRHATVVVKQSLMTYPLFGKILQGLAAIPVTRRNPREDLRQVLSVGTQRLNEGISVALFPQSTRSTGFDPARFNTLAVKLAARAGTPVVPVAFKTDFVGIGRLVRDFGPLRRDREIRIGIGAPLRMRADSKQVQKDLVGFLVETLAGWGVKIAEKQGEHE